MAKRHDSVKEPVLVSFHMEFDGGVLPVFFDLFSNSFEVV